ncbi:MULTISPECIES: helix-turn-helix domain-containing protein [Actinomadura]|uniref:Helix-turn-helix domain-containing protein n=1 Tax=Actinomadura yumaensis TaxID=111807 RepID=A0ABW2CRI4_9ACTN|nr:helix-turn-helix domain-containing protein [Actinomadura sp. J1-007]
MAVQRAVPEHYGTEGTAAASLQRTIEQAVRQSVCGSQREKRDGLRSGRELFENLGACEAGRRDPDGLQTALNAGGNAACRHLVKEARRLGATLENLTTALEDLFLFIDEMTAAAADGHARARREMADEREHLRRTLADLLVQDPPAGADAISGLAERAGWGPVRSLAAVAVRTPRDAPPPVLPPAFLARWTAPEPYLIWPDPDGPGEPPLPLHGVAVPVAIGPTVPLEKGAMSLRWARRVLALVERGAITGERPVRCLDHLPSLLTDMGEELIGAALPARFGPLLRLRPKRRRVLTDTLLVYLESRDNAVIAAERLRVHKQTVRNRIRDVETVLGDAIHDPARRIELLILLHHLARVADRGRR